MALYPYIKKPITMDYRSDSAYRVRPHSHSTYEIYYFHEGQCNFLIGNHIQRLQPGDMFLLHGMTLHTPMPNPHVRYVRTTVHFDFSYVHSLLNHGVLPDALQPLRQLRNHFIRFESAQQFEIETLFERMSSLYIQKDESSITRFQLALLDLLHFIRPHCLASAPPVSYRMSDKELYVQRAISFLEQRFTEELHMEDLKNELHLNETYLAKIFKEVTGMTIFNYVKKCRLNHAKFLLITEHKSSVSEICYAVGFKRVSHFSRLFKQEFKCAPNAFRRVFAEVLAE